MGAGATVRLRGPLEVERIRRAIACHCCGSLGDELARIYETASGVEVYCSSCPVGYEKAGGGVVRVVIEHVHEAESKSA